MSFHFWVLVKKKFIFHHLKWSLILDWRSISPIFILFYLLLFFSQGYLHKCCHLVPECQGCPANADHVNGKEKVAQHGTPEKDTPTMQQASNCCPLRPVLMQTTRILSVPKQTKPKFIWVQMQTPFFSADFLLFFLNNPCTSPPLVGTGLRQATGLTVRQGLSSATRAGSLWAAPAWAEGSLQVL